MPSAFISNKPLLTEALAWAMEARVRCDPEDDTAVRSSEHLIHGRTLWTQTHRLLAELFAALGESGQAEYASTVAEETEEALQQQESRPVERVPLPQRAIDTL